MSAFAPRLLVLPRDAADVGVLIDELMYQAFFLHRSPRSKVYKLGARAALQRRANGVETRCPHQAGSVEFDAWFAGYDEGRAIWASHVERVHANRAQACLPTTTV